jgi:hypothetical protein
LCSFPVCREIQPAIVYLGHFDLLRQDYTRAERMPQEIGSLAGLDYRHF